MTPIDEIFMQMENEEKKQFSKAKGFNTKIELHDESASIRNFKIESLIKVPDQKI